MYYALITLSALLFSLQFVANAGYRRADSAGWGAALRFALYSSLAGVVILFVINGFRLHCSPFSLAVAFGYALICISTSFCSIRALGNADLSTYSVFCMIGGMLIPFLYGILACGEEARPLRFVCCALMAVSVVLSIGKGTVAGGALKYYLGVFVLNGTVGVLSKFHQSHPDIAVESADFLMLTKLLTIALCILLLLRQKDRRLLPGWKAVAWASGYAGLNSVGNLLLLISLLHLPASVQYPTVTGGVIVCSTAIDLLTGRSFRPRKVISATVALAASVLMAL